MCTMYRVSLLRLGLNFEVRPAANKNFYLWLMLETMRALSVFAKKYLRSCGCSSNNFATAVKCVNSKIDVQNEIIDIRITEIQI